MERAERETKAMTPLLCQQQPASDGAASRRTRAQF
jgi:hypothetical protein